MIVYLGSDHGGFKLKEELKVWLAENKVALEDLGAYRENPDDDYPDFVVPVAEKVVEEQGREEECLGIILGRSGNGEAIAANKVKGARAAICVTVEAARKAREHNGANILSIGADYVDETTAKKMVKVFLETPFSGEERHKRRIEKIEKYEL